MKRKSAIFSVLKVRWLSQSRLAKCHDTLQQKERFKVCAKHFDFWLTKYRKIAASKKLEQMSVDFDRQRIINEYMGYWMQALRQRLKAQHLKADMLPYARAKLVTHRFFKQWLALYRKQSYISTKIFEREAQISHDYLKNCFEVLKGYLHGKQRARHGFQIGTQQYIYYLGKRTFASFHKYALKQ